MAALFCGGVLLGYYLGSKALERRWINGVTGVVGPICYFKFCFYHHGRLVSIFALLCKWIALFVVVVCFVFQFVVRLVCRQPVPSVE